MTSLFHDSGDNRFFDQSWINQTAPSTVTTENWEGPAVPNGDKFPVVTSPVKGGANALKLTWKSVTAGDWMALAASIGWIPQDLTIRTNLDFWVNSPVALAKTALPKLRFEAFSGTPNNTGKVEIGNYLAADLAANTWTEVSIPLADIWAADATFTSKDVTVQVTKQWTETAYRDVTTNNQLLPFEFAYLGVALALAGIGITIFGVVNKETLKTPPPPK